MALIILVALTAHHILTLLRCNGNIYIVVWDRLMTSASYAEYLRYHLSFSYTVAVIYCFAKPVTKLYCRNKDLHRNAFERDLVLRNVFFYPERIHSSSRFLSHKERVRNLTLEEGETPRNRLLNLLRHFLCNFFIM
jgi:hypothetical protein